MFSHESPYISYCRTVYLSHVFSLYICNCRTVFTTCSEPLLVPGTLAKKLFICFGLTVRMTMLFAKPTFLNGTAKHSTVAFSAWMRRPKVFRSFRISFDLVVISICPLCILLPYILVSTTISSPRGFGCWMHGTMHLHLPSRSPSIKPLKPPRHLWRHQSFTMKSIPNGSLKPVHTPIDWSRSARTWSSYAFLHAITKRGNFRTKAKMVPSTGTMCGSGISSSGLPAIRL